MDSKRWGWERMLHLQEAEDRKTPAAITWAAEFLINGGGKQGILRVVDQPSGRGSTQALFMRQKRDERRKLSRALFHVESGYL